MRALAVAAVILFHSTSILPGGWAGVDTFFVLSGYLITRILVAEVEVRGTVSLKRFYMRRFLRLTPAFACLLSFEVVRALWNPTYREATLKAVAVSAFYLMNWSRAFHWAPENVLDHTWSRATEEQFYLLWPTALLLTLRARPALWLAFAIALIVSWRTHLVLVGAGVDRTYNGFDTHADSLLLGCLLVFVKLDEVVLATLGRLVVLPVAVLAVTATTFRFDWALTQSVGLSLAGICAALIMLAAMRDGALKRFLSLPFLVYTGRLSYGLYLWRWPVSWMVGAHLPAGLPRILDVPLAFVSYPVAMASYHIVEKPFLRLKDRFEPTPNLVVPAPVGRAGA